MSHLVFALIFIFIDVARLVEVTANGVEYEEEEGQDEDGQYDVDCSITLLITYLPSIDDKQTFIKTHTNS